MSIWISFVGGKLNVYSLLPRAAVGLGEARAEAEDPVGALALVVDELRAPEARHAEDQRMVVGQRALAHQRVRDRQRQVLGEFAHLLGRVGEQDAAADVHQRCLRREQLADDLLRGLVVERGLAQHLGVGEHALPQRDVDLLREDVHRHVDQHRARAAALGERERLLDDLGKEVRRIHAPRALDERPVDLVLRRVGVQVHFLVRVLAVVVRRHVAGDHDHRDRVERRVGDTGRRIGEAGAQVRQHDRTSSSTPARSRRRRAPRSARGAC